MARDRDGGVVGRAVHHPQHERTAVVTHEGRHLGAVDVECASARGTGGPRPAATAHSLQRHEHVVGDRGQVDGGRVAAVHDDRVVERERGLELRALEAVEGTGRVGAQERLRTGEVSGGADERERELGPAFDDLVLEQAVVHEREADAAATIVTGIGVRAVDEAAGHERGEPELVGAALGGETAVHDRERALGVGTVDRGRQREVGAQAVVAHAVVELHVHPHEALAGAQLVGGDDVGRCAFVAALGARALVADRARAGSA